MKRLCGWRWARVALAAMLMLGSLQVGIQGQQHANALSDAEVERLRDTAADAPERVLAFDGFLNQRADALDRLSTGKRKPGREEDIHDLMEQMASILDDFADNLDDYNKRHSDIRKVLPKVVAATERWGTALRSAADAQEYDVARKLALESLKDVHETAELIIAEQKAWFQAHPPGKTAKSSE